MKKTLLIAVTVLMVMTFALVACSPAATPTPAATDAPAATEAAEVTDVPAATDAEASAAPAEGGLKFAYATSTLNNPFMVTIGEALKEACAANGNELIILDPQYDQAKQISQVEDAINQGVAGIFLLAVDSEGVKTVLETAKSKNVPVIAIDNPVSDVDLVAANVASDNFYAGVLVGEAMIKDFPEGAKVAIIDSPTMTACVDRFDGFVQALKDAKVEDKFPIVAQQDGMASLEKAMPIAESMIQANPDIQAFYGINDPTALGIIASLKAANKLEGVKVYGVDGSPDGKTAIVSGELVMTSAQSPVNLAKTSYENMQTVLGGGTIEKDIAVDTFAINAENVEEYGVDGWQ